MTTTESLRALGERLQAESPRAVFGEPIAAHGRTLIPVARVGYGFGARGGKTGPGGDEKGEGGGGGLGANPAGIVEVTEHGTRFIPIVDPVRMISVLIWGFVIAYILTYRRRKRGSF